jgi:dihydropteroate synthase
MGIVNVTPDSFSDGGSFFEPRSAIERGLQLVDDGADLLDVGGESTRPYSTPVSAAEELRRVMPVIEALVARAKVPISIDTSKAAVAAAALDAGVQIVNDVTGLSGDPAMLTLILDRQPGVCSMHMLGTPQTMQDDPQYQEVVTDVFNYLRSRRDALEKAGLTRDRISLDPGIGFGKTTQHNLALLKQVNRFHALGCPLLLGYSRKGFIGRVLDDLAADRTAGGIGVALSLALQGVQILRVHDVAPVRQALLLFEACGGLPGTKT